MNDYQLNKIKYFLQDKIEAFNNNKFDYLYNELEDIDSNNAYLNHNNALKPVFTELLFKIGVNPLNYLIYVPKGFAYGLDIEKFTIPQHIKQIDNFAFLNCTKLKIIRIGNSVKNIGINAFGSCENLHHISIPDSVIDMGDSALSACRNLETVQLSKNLNLFDAAIFNMCYNLKEVNIAITISKLNSIFKTTGFDNTNYICKCIDGDAKYEENAWRPINK